MGAEDIFAYWKIFETPLGRPVVLAIFGGVLFAVTVVTEIFCEVDVDFGRGDFRESSIVVDCECVFGVTGGPAAGLGWTASPGDAHPAFFVRARAKPLGRRYSIDASSASTSGLAFRDRRRGGIARVSSTRSCLRHLTKQGSLVAIRFQSRRGRHQRLNQSRYMLHATGSVQVDKSYPIDVRWSNWHTSVPAMMLNVKSAFAPAALGTRVIRRVAGEIGERVGSAENGGERSP